MENDKTVNQQGLEILCCNPFCKQPIIDERAIYDTKSEQIYHYKLSCINEGMKWIWAIRGTMPQKTDYEIIPLDEARELKEADRLKEILKMP